MSLNNSLQDQRIDVILGCQGVAFETDDKIKQRLYPRVSTRFSNICMRRSTSIVVFEAGESGVTRRTCSAREGGVAE
jgi:hypothetical protein